MRQVRAKLTAVWLVGALLVLWAGPAAAAAKKYEALVMDAVTGQVLQAYNADALSYPASLTKMMTLYLTFEALQQGRLKLEQRLNVSEWAASQEPTKLDLEPGDSLTVEEAVLGLVVKSANDAAVVLGETLGGSESRFAEIMTAKAAALGMRSTRFRNASGLPNLAQVTTARDMATLARALIRDFPQYYPYFDTRAFTFQGVTIMTHNHVLVNYRGADGLKTGFIHASGYNLVTSAVRNGRRLIGVVLGGRSGGARDVAMMRLLDQGFATAAVVREAQAPAPSTAAKAAVIAAAAAAPATVAVPVTAVSPAPTTAVAMAPASAPAAAPAAPAPGVTETAQSFLPAAPLDDDVASSEKPASTRVGRARTAPALAMVESENDEVRIVGWGIQVGAYSHQAQARAAALKMKRSSTGLARATVAVARSHAGRGTVYRALLTGLSAGAARAACNKIHRRGGECLILTHGSEHNVAALH